VPGLPHHITQRGVRSIPIFDHDGNRELYILCPRNGDNSFLDVSGATVDVLVEHNTIRQSDTGITVTRSDEAVPARIPVRRNQIDGPATPVSGGAGQGAMVLP